MPPPPAGSGSPAAALESATRFLSELTATAEGFHSDPPRRFSAYLKRLHLALLQLAHSDLSSAAAHTALRGVAADLEKCRKTLADYRSKSRIYLLINCKPLCASLRDAAVSIASWLALLDSPLASDSDLRKKIADLSQDMHNSDLKVTENEERVYCTLQKEAEVRQNSKAVQSAIIMDLARALGTDSSDHGKLAEQIKLLRADLAASSSIAERRILTSLEKIFDSWSMEPCTVTGALDACFEENAHIPPFKNFLCPLTKEVMKDPVVLESSQTYERTAIRYWFDRCLDDGRDPTCPVTGQVLNTLQLRPNIGLKGAIEEWVNRNIEVQIMSAVQCLSEGDSSTVESLERVFDNVYRIAEEHPSSRYKVRNAGIVGLVVRMLKDQSKRMGSQLRSKALMVMNGMVKDEESKLIMLEEGMTRLAIRSLTASSEKERELALRLLLEFSSEEDYCRKIAMEKGALVLLSSVTGNLEYPTLSNIAEEILKNVEKEGNIEHLAIAGRYQPLLTRLCDGTEDVRIEIATLVGKMPLTNSGKDHIARKGGQALVEMLSSTLEGKASSLQALYNLSTLDDNATVLVNLGVLPALTSILFATQQDDSSDLRDMAASIIANIVSNSGHWELSSADKEGHPMQSEFVIRRLLELLSQSSCKCQAAVLHILCGIVSSPQASDLAATHIKTSNGIVAIVPYLEHSDPDPRTHALRLTSLLSGKLGQILFEVLRASNKLLLLKEKLLDSECPLVERSEIVSILARLPIPDAEVKSILGPDLLKWTVNNLKDQKLSAVGKNSKNARIAVDGFLGVLLHYARSPDPEILALVQENRFMAIFQEHLSNHFHDRAKQQAALGLKYLSQSARISVAARDSEPQPPRGFCVPLVFLCGKAPAAPPVLCPLHSIACEEYSSFCLLQGKTIKPLVDLMNDENTKVQIAAVEALSTVVVDAQSLKNAAKELEQLGLFDAAVHLFKDVRPGELQERVISLLDKFLRVESIVQLYATDQDLVRALVEALKHGNANTKRHAQEILTNLREISGVGGRSSNPSHGKRTTQ